MFFTLKKLAICFALHVLIATEGQGKPVVVKKPTVERASLFVLAVGTNQYLDDFFPPLKWAESDATRFASELGKDSEFKVERIVLTGAKVSKTSIKDAIKSISARSKSADMIIVYLSGHGSLRLGKDGELEPVLVLPDTKSSDLTLTSLPQKKIISWIDALKLRKKILITASCHSGVGKSRLTPEIKKILSQNKSALAPELSDTSEGMIVLSAAARNEVAIEDDRFSSDLYTHFFLTSLDVYDRNQDGSVSVLEAHDYASEMTFKGTKGRQRPTIQAEAIGDIDFPLRGKKTKKALPLLQEYNQQFAGIEVDINRQQKGRLPFAFPLLPGRNVVTIYSQDRADVIGEYVFKAQPGETVTVEKILAGQPFSAGPFFSLVQPDERVYGKLMGEASAIVTGVYGAWRVDRVIATLKLQMPTRSKEEVLPGIDVSLTENLLTAHTGYRMLQLSSFALNGSLLVGASQIDMTVSDQNTGYAQSASSSGLVYGAGFGASWSPGSLMVFSLDAELQKLKHDFGSFGSMNANRKLFTIGMGFTFGGIARRK